MAKQISKEQINELITALEDTPTEFAERLEVSIPTVRNWKEGACERIHPRNNKRLKNLYIKHVGQLS